MSDLLKVVVDRRTWGRGDPSNSALLSSTTGKMCCLGFACLAAGLTKEQIKDRRVPSHIRDLLPAALNKLVSAGGLDSTVANLMMYENDRGNPECREAKLIELGCEAGIEFEFIN